MQNENIKRNFLWNTVGSLTYFAAQWLFTLLVWRFGNIQTATQNAGLLNISLTLTNTFLALASYGMYNYQVSDLTGKFNNTSYVYSRNFTCFTAVMLCAVYVFGVGFFNTPYAIPQILCIFFMLLFRMVESKTDVYNAILQKNYRLDLVGKTYALRGIISLLCFVVCLALTNSVTTTLFVLLLFNVSIYLFFTKRIIKPFYNKEETNFSQVKALLIVCAPLALYSILSTASANIPKILLERIHGAEILGIYGSVTAPVLLLQIGATYLFTPFITYFANYYNSKNKAAFYKILLKVSAAIFALMPLGFLVAHFLGEWGLATFVNANLSQYQYLLMPMVICAVLAAYVLFVSMVLTVMREIKGLILANVFGIITAFVVSVPLINAFNMQGTSFAAIAALLVQTAFLCVFLILKIKKSFR